RLLSDDRFPVTVGHHGLTPWGLLHDFGLHLLLCDARPYDALICTSRSAMATIRATMAHAREALARSHGIAPELRGRLELIPLGVDTDVFRPRPKRPLRERFGLPKEATLLLWFGRFSFGTKANLLPLLRVLRDVKDDCPGIPLCLVIAGEK